MRLMTPVVAFAISLISSPSTAATFLIFNGSTGVFGNDQVSASMFTDTLSFETPHNGQYLISGTLSSSYQPGAEADQDIDFTSVNLNGTDFASGSTGQFEFRYVQNVAALGTNLFSISGSSGDNSSYAGTLNIAAVPEPSTWLSMLIGFAGIGFALRAGRPTVQLRRAVGP